MRLSRIANHLRSLIIGVSLLCGITRLCSGQITFDGCRDANNNPVASISALNVNDIAVATFAGGRPVIYYNPQVVAGVHPQTRLFFYAHECAHHALGHLGDGGVSSDKESEADCWAINLLVQRRFVTNRDISIIQADIAQFGRVDWTHVAGPQQAILLLSCIQGNEEPTPPRRTGHWETSSCVHPAHPRGDLVPCQHPCYLPNGFAVPCHPMGDLYPCSHPAHPQGDRTSKRRRSTRRIQLLQQTSAGCSTLKIRC